MPYRSLVALTFVAIAGAADPLWGEEPPAPGKIGYHLVRTVLQTDVTWTLSCAAEPGATASDPLTASVGVEAAVTSRFEADPKAARELQADGLGRALKDTDLRVALYETGTLKSVNATVVDRTFDFVSNVVTGTARLVIGAVSSGIFKGLAVPHGMAAAPLPPAPCSAAASSTTRAIDTERGNLAKTRALLQEARWQLVNYKSNGKSHELQLETIKELTAQQTATEARLARLAGSLQVKAACTIVPDGTATPGICAFPQPAAGEWFGEGVLPTLDVLVKTAVIGGEWGTAAAAAAETVAYRVPRTALVELSAHRTVIGAGVVSLAQAGDERVLPLYQGGKLLVAELEFSPAGVPIKAHYSSASRAAKWAEVYAKSTESLAKVADAVAGAPAADLKREIELLKLEAAKAEAEGALAKAKKAAGETR